MTREELWLAAIAGLDGVNPPDYPVWHYEEMLAAIYDAVVGADSPRPFPERSWHLDEFLYAVYCVAAGLDDPGCPEPTDRIELFWNGVYDGVKGEAGASVPTPVWRIEEFLSAVFTASAGWGERTLTGSIVSFIGRANTEILALTAAITPIQDLHGYDNPWPAGGGVNKWDEVWEQGSIDNSTGLDKPASTGIRGKNYIPVVAGESYYICNLDTDNLIRYYYYDSAYGFISTSAVNNAVLTIPSGVSYMRIRSTGTYGNVYKNDWAVNYPATVTTYSPYSNICPITGWTGANAYVSPTQDVADATTYPVTWQTEAGTVYGGTVDVVTGVLTVDRVYALLNDSSAWYEVSGTPKYRYSTAFADRKKYNNSYDGLCACSYIQVNALEYTNTGRWVSSSSNNFGIESSGLTLAQIQQDATDGKIAIVYELATPLTYQLTPQTVTALVGQNYVWADTGDVTVTVKGAGVA